MSVIQKLQQWRGLGPLELSSHQKIFMEHRKIGRVIVLFSVNCKIMCPPSKSFTLWLRSYRSLAIPGSDLYMTLQTCLSDVPSSIPWLAAYCNDRGFFHGLLQSLKMTVVTMGVLRDQIVTHHPPHNITYDYEAPSLSDTRCSRRHTCIFLLSPMRSLELLACKQNSDPSTRTWVAAIRLARGFSALVQLHVPLRLSSLLCFIYQHHMV